MAEAHALCAGADLLLCVGSSLEVYPVAGLPSAGARRRRPAGDRDPGPDPVRPRRRGEARGRRGRGARRGPGGALRLSRSAVRRRGGAARARTPRRVSAILGCPLGRQVPAQGLVRCVAGDRPAAVELAEVLVSCPGACSASRSAEHRLEADPDLHRRLAHAAAVQVGPGAQDQLLADQRPLARRPAGRPSAPAAAARRRGPGVRRPAGPPAPPRTGRRRGRRPRRSRPGSPARVERGVRDRRVGACDAARRERARRRARAPPPPARRGAPRRRAAQSSHASGSSGTGSGIDHGQLGHGHRRRRLAGRPASASACRRSRRGGAGAPNVRATSTASVAPGSPADAPDSGRRRSRTSRRTRTGRRGSYSGNPSLPGANTFRDRVAQEIYSPTWASDARPWSLPDFFFLVGIE